MLGISECMELGAQVEPSREVRSGDAPQSQSPMERSSNRCDGAGRARRWECDGHFISSRRLEAAQVRPVTANFGVSRSESSHLIQGDIYHVLAAIHNCFKLNTV